MSKKKREKKKNNLGKDQKEFIEKKVMSLGTLEKVKVFYNRDDEVSKYAIDIAERLE